MTSGSKIYICDISDRTTCKQLSQNSGNLPAVAFYGHIAGKAFQLSIGILDQLLKLVLHFCVAF